MGWCLEILYLVRFLSYALEKLDTRMSHCSWLRTLAFLFIATHTLFVQGAFSCIIRDTELSYPSTRDSQVKEPTPVLVGEGRESERERERE